MFCSAGYIRCYYVVPHHAHIQTPPTTLPVQTQHAHTQTHLLPFQFRRLESEAIPGMRLEITTCHRSLPPVRRCACACACNSGRERVVLGATCSGWRGRVVTTRNDICAGERRRCTDSTASRGEVLLQCTWSQTSHTLLDRRHPPLAVFAVYPK